MTVDQARRLRRVARWHRRLALFIAAWLLLLAGSGVLINHANDWGLDRANLPAALQRALYGLDAGGQDHCGAAAVEGIECADVFARLALPKGALLLSDNSVYLLDDSGRLVERLAASQLGLGRLEAGLQHGDRIYLRDARVTVMTDAELLDSRALEAGELEAMAGRAWQQRGAGGISWERLLLDLHAARFLGPLAGLFSDLMALLIVVLAVTGYWMHRLKKRRDRSASLREF